jgi:predicted negative regulator of RcsB-dependent stress response
VQQEPVAEVESSWQINALAWLETNKLNLAYAGAVALAVWLAAYTYQHVRRGKEAEANAALAGLSKPADRAGKAPQPAAADYLRVAEQHAGTAAAERAQLFAADRLFSEGKPGEAKAQFEQFLRKFSTSPAVPVALLGVAACQEASGEVDKAIASYEQVTTVHSDAPEAAQAKLALGVLQEQKGKPDAALRLYDEILRAKKSSVWRAEAEMRREQVVRKHPQLAPGAVSAAAPVPATNAPAAPTKATNAPAKK